ncbi:uncharacterized protein LOC134214476 [Armigeres subalbatus]|uniref:uncharacterized protein LOC134214476 n=1 Tax=Armigeres subalbatus TaxID=124917 RepID=UPI002ED495A0
MDPLLSDKQRRATDIRDAIQKYHAERNPWGPDHRAHAVFLGVQRNNARRRFHIADNGKRCCSCIGWILLLVAACTAAWYTWSRVIDSANNLATNFPALRTIGEKQCLPTEPVTNSFVQVVNCTLQQTGLFAERLALVLKSGYDV